MTHKSNYGDYQTPLIFAEKVCDYLKNIRHIKPSIVIEPTCGAGNLLKSSLIFNANKYYGIEINPKYCKICREYINNDKVKIINANFFNFSLKSLIKNNDNVLIIGNPPWITNSTLSHVKKDNLPLPLKKNFKGLRGIDAITGESNFDICECVILKILSECLGTDTIISMLCKTSVALNVFKYLKQNHIPFTSFDILEFNSKKIFKVDVPSCLMVITLTHEPVSLDRCSIYDFNYPKKIKSQSGYINGKFYGNLDHKIEDFSGHCFMQWRQGIKHDCSKVMELTKICGNFQNGFKENVEIEDDLIFPLIKSSMFKSPIIHNFSKYVIVTQKKTGEDTEYISKKLPRTWAYLSKYKNLFESRKSRIYHNTPPFSMFGVGEYSYSKYKVGVSGFYKRPLFSLLYSEDGKPVMLDDTGYFIGLNNFNMAYIAMLFLNSNKVQNFLTHFALLESKRPYTKKILDQIDFGKIIKSISFNELKKTEISLNLKPYITKNMYNLFINYINKK